MNTENESKNEGRWYQLLPKQREAKPALLRVGSYWVDACDGIETLVSATDIFCAPEESLLKEWGLMHDTVSHPTDRACATVYRMRTSFEELARIASPYFARVTLTQAQAVCFCRANYSENSRICFEQANDTFVPFMLGERQVIVRIDDDPSWGGKLSFHLFRFDKITTDAPFGVPIATQVVFLSTVDSREFLRPLLTD